MADITPLRVGFVHPDLGIGGAEKLIVDAAVSLQDRGHEVVIFTSRHDPKRCFEETRNGTLKVHVLGDSIVPRTILNSLHIVCASLRQIHLSLLLLASIYLPFRIPFISPLSPMESFDIFIVDQLSVCVPILRWFGQTRVVFYCHFPDKLLAGGREVEVDNVGRSDMNPREAKKKESKKAPGLLKRLYRLPFDKMEEATTGESDIVLANSSFTARVYDRAFPTLKQKPRVVYPCIKVEQYVGLDPAETNNDKNVQMIRSDKATFVSLNRFEAKKNIELALEAFSLVKKDRPNGSMRLVVAGGYDKALKDNIDTYARLTKFCDDSGLRYVTIRPEDGDSTPTSTEVNKAEVVFLLNFTDGQRASLLTADSSIALLYTPENEHFGIVPVEAMACGLPVLGVNSGGPTETVVDTDAELSGEGATGLLRRPEADQWVRAMSTLFDLSPNDRARIARAGKERVRKNFSSEKLGEEMELACYEAVSRGRVGLEEQCLLLIGALGLAWIMAAIAVLFSQIPASYFQ
ncbi:hypothetical protein FFLO_02530 [Filobasidium floriforme]|uniref:Alpha-1,3/1,6-mannosyltransferase ALG2 n=1 Tax=Filobasidium floriforme TaxID=5210 RepID=A0A8K0JML0_9TREE|nr:hypothetical protein FFLO_02530 [Filobasidium floriforme]